MESNMTNSSTKPLPPIPQESPEPVTTVVQEGVFQRSDSNLNKMNIRYVLNGSDMQGHQAKTSFFQREASQPATEVGQDSIANGSVHSSVKMNPNLLLKETNLPGYSDETPPPIVPISDGHYDPPAVHNIHSSVHRGLALAALSCVPPPEASYAEANSSPHHHGHSATSWYEDSPPDSPVAGAPSATPVREIQQECQFPAVDNPAIRVPDQDFTPAQFPTIEQMLALIDREKENCRRANETPNPGSSSSAYRLALPNSASTNIYHADQTTGSDYQAPDFVIRNAESPRFVSPGTIGEVTPTMAIWTPSPSCLNGCCASDMPPQEPPVLAPSSPPFVPLQQISAWDSDKSDEVDNGRLVLVGHPILREFEHGSDNFDENDSSVTVTFEAQVDWDDTTPDSPLLDSPPSPAPYPPSPERPPSDPCEYSYPGAPRAGIPPSCNIPLDPRLTEPTFRSDYMSSPTSYPAWLRPTDMDSVDQSLVPPHLNVTKKSPTFNMNVPVHDVSQHQTAVHASEPTNEERSYAASFVGNESSVNTPSSYATLSRASRSPDVSSSEGSMDSRGTKRKRFTKNLFGKKGYLEDNEGQRDKKFKFIKGALQKGHSTIGSIKGIVSICDSAFETCYSD
jgi:hypothetical protein